MTNVRYPLGITLGDISSHTIVNTLKEKSEAIAAANDQHNNNESQPPQDASVACIIDHLDLPAVYFATAKPDIKKTNKHFNKLLEQISGTKIQCKKINSELKRPLDDYRQEFFDAIEQQQQRALQTGRNIDRAMLPIIFDEQGGIIALTLRVTLIKDDRQHVQGVLSVFENQSTTLASKHILDWYYQCYRNTKQAIRQFIRHIGLEQALWDKSDTFTQRELDCIIYLAEGKTAKETAKELGISHRTVETHLENVKIKFNTSKKTEMLSLFFRHYRSA